MYRLDTVDIVMRAANYDDDAGLWVGNKARIFVQNGPIGVHGGTGKLTNYVTVARTNTGWIHGWPSLGG